MVPRTPNHTTTRTYTNITGTNGNPHKSTNRPLPDAFKSTNRPLPDAVVECKPTSR
ncbi:MAG: hypothetical protein QW815_03060 [Nitrososphaerota archaeon]